MPTRLLRPLAVAAALTAAAGLSAGDAPADVDPARRLAADLAFLTGGLDKPPEKRAVPTLRAAAMLVALSAAEPARGQAVKVAEALDDKEYAAAKRAVADLAPTAGPAADPAALAKAADFDLAALMSAFRPTKVGGMNLEKDIRTLGKKAADVDLAGLVAARVHAIGAYTLVLPTPEAAVNPDGKAKWDRFTRDMMAAAADTAAEAAKGGKADKAKLAAGMRQMEAACTACHNAYRTN